MIHTVNVQKDAFELVDVRTGTFKSHPDEARTMIPCCFCCFCFSDVGFISMILDLFLILSFFMISFHQNPFNDSVNLMRIQFHFAALGCFLTWLQVMFYIGKLPKIGKYVQMFKTVCWSVMEFLIAWIFLLLAFTFAFQILFPDYENFDGFFSTFINLLIFMFGEINYNELLLPDKNNKAYSGIFFAIPNLLLLFFIFLICIVLMNLLVGLAVSDIQTLSKSARLRRLVQQVDHALNS